MRGRSMKISQTSAGNRITWLKAKIAEIDAALARPVTGVGPIPGVMPGPSGNQTLWHWKVSAESRFSSQKRKLEYQEELRALANCEQIATRPPTHTKRQRKLAKRDTVIFAAILMELKSVKYCAFLQDHGIKPNWSESGPATYLRGYQVGDPWRKKVQDEKTRAKLQMNGYAEPELANAFSIHLPKQFDELSPMLRSRNSRHASKHSRPVQPRKY